MSMDFPRVNLLYRSEQRYQGIVSRRFMALVLFITPALLAVLLGAAQFVQRSWLTTNLETSRDIWTDLQPRLALVQEEKQALSTNQQTLDLFNGWLDSQLAPVALMEDIQMLVPENIQLIKLSIRSEAGRSAFASRKDLQSSCTLVIEGIAAGAEAETSVIQLRKDFLACPRIGATFDSLNLASMRKKTTLDGAITREFRLIGKGVLGGAAE